MLPIETPPKKKKALPVVSPTWSAHKTALHDYSMTNMSSDVDPFALSVALPDQSGHLFGCSMLGCFRFPADVRGSGTPMIRVQNRVTSLV